MGAGEPKFGPKAGTGDAQRRARRNLLRGGVVALALLVALVAWLTSRGSSSDSSEPAPRVLTAPALREVAIAAAHPIYWVGPTAGAAYELRELEGNGTQVLYVPAAAPSEAAAADTLTIGSYPLADPTQAVRNYATSSGAIVRHGRDGHLVVSNRKDPTSVYFAAPDNSVEVEVYSPSADRSMRLALSGRTRPVR